MEALKQRVFALVATQDSGSVMSLTTHCLLVENENKHVYFMENLKVISVCSGSSVVMDDLNNNDDEKMITLINQRGV